MMAYTMYQIFSWGDSGQSLWVSRVPRLDVVKDYQVTAIVDTVDKAPNDVVTYVERYSSYKIPDGKNVYEELFDAAKRDTLRFLADGHETVITCNAGRNRSATVAALVIRQLTGVSGAEALKWVRRQRPRAVANPHFEDWLTSLPGFAV